jgi:xanthine/uracil/vitamin C permease (AzgA family)
MADIGVAVLLFLIGLKLDMHIIRALGRVATATGLGQVLFTSVVGFAICLALGFDAWTSAYVAVALTFSSTIIIVKPLTPASQRRCCEALMSISLLYRRPADFCGRIRANSVLLAKRERELRCNLTEIAPLTALPSLVLR